MEQKYCCENCEDVFKESQAKLESSQDEDFDDHDYLVCPNCGYSDLKEVPESTKLTDYYDV